MITTPTTTPQPLLPETRTNSDVACPPPGHPCNEYATSLPRTAVRSAWAMHDLEEGNLHWSIATQWSLNRISATQISMASNQVTQRIQNKNICKFYNKGTCSHDASHGQYRHTQGILMKMSREILLFLYQKWYKNFMKWHHLNLKKAKMMTKGRQ